MFKLSRIVTFIKIIALVLVGVGIGSVAYGQKADGRAGVMPELGAYDALSTGNKKIAEALFNGQVVTDNGKAPLSLDLIAASKHRNGWGRIFRQLKRDGLIDAKNLGELTSGRYYGLAAGKRAGANRSARATVVTTASGRQIIVDKKSRSRPAKRNRGRRIDRRGSEHMGQHAAGIFSTGSTYRGRMDYSGNSRDASSLGIATGKGVGTSNIITRQPKTLK